MTAKSQLPKRVVRFYGNLDFALDTIGAQQMTLVHTSKLNDSFDPYFFFETDFEARYDSLLDFVKKQHPNDIKWFLQQVPVDTWEQSVNNVRNHMKAHCKAIDILHRAIDK